MPLDMKLPPLILAPRVVIGACDLAGAGGRALLALRGDAPAQIIELGDSLGDQGLPDQDLRAVYSPPDAPASPPGLLVYTPQGSSKDEQVSLIIINAAAPASQQTRLALAILQTLRASHGPFTAGNPLLVVAALRLQGLALSQTLEAKPLVLPLNAAEVLPGLEGCAQLGGDMPIEDGVVAALVHGLQATETPACLITTPGYRPRVVDSQQAGNFVDDGYEAASRLARAVALVTCLPLDEAALRESKPSLSALLGDTQDASGGDIMYM